MYNGKVGDPTVMRCFLPGHTLDGTSCFSMAKGLSSRYYSEKNKVVLQTTLMPEVPKKLENASFLDYLLTVPYNVFLNTSDFNWQFVTSMRPLGGPGMSTELCMLNLDEAESKKFKDGCKAKGIKPYAALIYAAYHGYKTVEGAIPYGITQQASMQSRSYTPDKSSGISLEEFRKERRFVGDWLIGMMHYFGDEFSYEDAQQVYETTLKNLKSMEGNALSAAQSKAYCALGGAGIFEFFPFYAERARVFDGIFFNNYGLRTIHPDAELYSYNWGAPMRLGFNTLNVNGKTCTCFASSHMSLTKLRKIRSVVKKIFAEVMDSA